MMTDDDQPVLGIYEKNRLECYQPRRSPGRSLTAFNLDVIKTLKYDSSFWRTFCLYDHLPH